MNSKIQSASRLELDGRLYIARHGETIFNARGRLQGGHAHTPLTRAGFAQADQMGRELAQILGQQPDIQLWASDTGRALQTLSIITEHLDLDWHSASRDARLREMNTGEWGGQYYQQLMQQLGSDAVIDMRTRLLREAPGGESYADMAARLAAWVDDARASPGDRLVIMHGLSSRVLRGLLCDCPPPPGYDVPIADGLPQGSVVRIENGVEEVIIRGDGGERA